MGTSGERPRLLLGLDVGTQSLRAALVDVNGGTVAFGVAPIETTYPRPTWAEQEPVAWWSAACKAVRLAMTEGNATPEQVDRDRSGLHGLHGRRDRSRRRAPPPCPALDGSACFSPRLTRSAIPAIPC